MEEIDLTLDEIIERRGIQKIGHPASGSGGGGAGRGGGGFEKANENFDYDESTFRCIRETYGDGFYYVANRKKSVPDARNRIVENKRQRIRDARDTLIENGRGQDARYRLDNRARQQYHPYHPGGMPPQPRNGAGYGGPANYRPRDPLVMLSDEYVPTCLAPQPSWLSMPQYQPGRPIDTIVLDDDDAAESNVQGYGGLVEMDQVAMPKPSGSAGFSASRTVSSGSYSTMPPLPQFRTVRATNNTIAGSNGTGAVGAAAATGGSSLMPYSEPDPFDHYEVNRRPNFSVPPPSLPSIRVRPINSILRSPAQPRSAADGEVSANLSANMRARLERAPNPNKSMGIFAQSHSGNAPIKSYSTGQSTTPPSPPRITSGYRIVVSNLHLTVTQIDIQELFEDVGDLLESRLVRPGVAEVIYRNLKDAEKAVEAYHNRLLDGQPMNCLLVNPRATYKPTATVTAKYGR